MAVTRSDHSGNHTEPSLGLSELTFVESKGPGVQGSTQGCARKSKAQRRRDDVRGTKIVTKILN